jgi:hypothetical protein
MAAGERVKLKLVRNWPRFNNGRNRDKLEALERIVVVTKDQFDIAVSNWLDQKHPGQSRPSLAVISDYAAIYLSERHYTVSAPRAERLFQEFFDDLTAAPERPAKADQDVVPRGQAPKPS